MATEMNLKLEKDSTPTFFRCSKTSSEFNTLSSLLRTPKCLLVILKVVVLLGSMSSGKHDDNLPSSMRCSWVMCWMKLYFQNVRHCLFNLTGQIRQLRGTLVHGELSLPSSRPSLLLQCCIIYLRDRTYTQIRWYRREWRSRNLPVELDVP